MSISINDVIDDLVTTNELGDGRREYEQTPDGLVCRTWMDRTDPEKETGTYRIRFEIEKTR